MIDLSDIVCSCSLVHQLFEYKISIIERNTSEFCQLFSNGKYLHGEKSELFLSSGWNLILSSILERKFKSF